MVVRRDSCDESIIIGDNIVARLSISAGDKVRLGIKCPRK